MNSNENSLPDPNSAPGAPLIIGVGLIMAAVWMVVWRGSLDGLFYLDDHRVILESEHIRHLWPLEPFLRNNRPFAFYSFAVNYHFSGTDPFGYHVVNLGIHVANGLLLYTGCLLAGSLWRKPEVGMKGNHLSREWLGVSALVATAWALHPLTTQAVTYIAQRYEALASFGYLAAWVGSLVYLNGYRLVGCFIIFMAAWIGLMSKEVFATAPLVIVMFDHWITRQSFVTILGRRWLPYGLMMTPYIWFIPSVSRFFDTTKTGSSMGLGLESLSSWQYLRTQPEVLWRYLRLCVWPDDLCFDYVWGVQSNPWIYLPLGATILCLVGLGGYLYYRGTPVHRSERPSTREYGLAGWLILTFFFILAPTCSVMPIADIAFEHRMYLASAVVVTGIILAASTLARRLIAQSERPLVLKLGLGCIVLACLSLLAWRTHLRNLDYQNELALWRSVVRVAPQSPRAWYNVGKSLYERGDREGALRPMISAVGLSNTSVPFHDVGLANCLYDIGRYEEAVTLYQRAIAKKHNYPEAHNNLGVAYFEQGKLGAADAAYRTAAELGHPEAEYNLALVFIEQDLPQEAIPLLEETLAKHPEIAVAARRLSWILATAGDPNLRDVQRAERLLREYYDVESSESSYVLDTHAAIQAAYGNFELATQIALRALAIAESTPEPNAELLSAVQQRIKCYRNGESWIGGNQP